MTTRYRMFHWAICVMLAMPLALWAAPPTVQVDPPNLHGSRTVEAQTASAVIRDYLESWQSLRQAMQQDRPNLLDRDFAGAAKDKLTDTVQDQAKFGIQTRYQDRSHDLQIVFYSPEGLSIQMIDTVVYDQQVLLHGKALAKQRMHARYIVVMTPAEARWQVRIFQADPAAQ
ncbi:MAG: hypothetical protein ACRD28_12895 [Acidobacteriaceae bacterium]